MMKIDEGWLVTDSEKVVQKRTGAIFKGPILKLLDRKNEAGEIVPETLEDYYEVSEKL